MMTRKMILIASVAGIALTAPAYADKGGHGGGNQQQQAQQKQAQPQQQVQPQQQAKQERGNGGGQQVQRQERPQQMQRAERPQQIQRAERAQQVERKQQRAERPQQMQRIERPQQVDRQQQRVERQAQRVERPQKFERQQQRVERQAQRVERPQQFDRQQQRVDRQSQRVERQAQRDERQAMPSFDRQQGKAERRVAEQSSAPRDIRQFDTRALRPSAPVFATREMRPMKSFKAKFDDRQSISIGQRVAPSNALAPVPTYFANNYVDTPDHYYRYDDRLGSIYRIERNDGIVRSMIPLFGGYNVGNPWPQTYYSSYVPDGYRDYYYDTPDYFYRNDGYGIYQVDSSTQLISALVALVTGQSYGIGQMLPASYDVYNVPLDYRDRYADNDDNYYRYGDGYIYQVDNGSRRIAARYPIYDDNYYVGETWPSAYPDYNVPYGYRSAYYDTPQYQYRYADSGIYQVDPTSQVIRALVALVSGNQFAVGQAMPAGYDSYNVPFDYRDRYADSNDQWYRYANGNVYQVDPSTGLIEQAYPIYT